MNERGKSTRVIVNCLLVFMVLFGASQSHAKDIPGATQTSWGVSPSGSFQFQIPIVTPVGRNGVQPNVSINFSSGSGNGLLGVGWGLSGMGAITRCGRTIATDGIKGGVLHDANDRFCLNGKRLIQISGGTYGAANSELRTEIDEISKIVAKGPMISNQIGGSAPSYFEVWRRDGSWQEYGNSTSSRVTLPGSTSVSAWKLSHSHDRSGNYYEVTYDTTTDQHFPDKIDYTLGAGGDTGHQIDFDFELRPDIRTSYRAGLPIVMNKRLKSVRVLHDSTTIREYVMDYAQGEASQRSRLISVIEKGLNGNAMPPIEIQWKTDTGGYENAATASDKAPDDLIEYHTFTRYFAGGSESGAVKQLNRGSIVDLNGDGLLDMVISYRAPNGTHTKAAYLKTASGWSTNQSNWHLPRPLRSYDDAIVNYVNPARFKSPVINMGQLVDVNGDGLVDVVYSYKLDIKRHQNGDDVAPDSEIEEVTETYLNTGTGFALTASTVWEPKDILFDYLSNSGSEWVPAWGQNNDNLRVETVRGRLMDINGDGLVDWISAWYNYTSGGNGIQNTTTWINDGSGWNEDSDYDLPDVFVQYRGLYTLPHGSFVDVNGDGLQDWVQAYHASLESPQYGTWFNTGEKFEPAPSHFNLPEVIHHNQNGWNDIPAVTRGSFVDVNGDGLRDWVTSYKDPGASGTIGQSVRVNTGNGWQLEGSNGYDPEFVHVDYTDSSFARGWPVNRNGNYLDLNRDGLLDYVESVKNSTGSISKKAWINSGSEWVLEANGSPYIPIELYYDYTDEENAKSHFGHFRDINNDGGIDWVKSRVGETALSRLNKLPRVDELFQVRTTMGVEVRPNFLPLTDSNTLYQKGTGSAEADSAHIAGPIYVTASLQTSNADASGTGWNTTYYSYEGAQVHRKGRGFLGFKSRTVSDDATGLTSHTEFRQDFPFIGAVVERRVTEIANTNSSEWLTSTTNTYSEKSLDNGKTTFPFLMMSTSQNAELDTNGGNEYRWTRRTLNNVDNYGNPDVTTTEVGTGATNILNVSSVNNDYKSADTVTWLVGQLEKATSQVQDMTGSDPIITRANEFTYWPSTGLLKTVLREPDSNDDTLKLLTTYDYDDYGNLEKETVTSFGTLAETRTNTIEYDPDNRLPDKLINTLSQPASIAYHAECDQPEIVTGVDLQPTDFDYDDFCRQTRVEDSAGVFVTTDYFDSGLNCPTGDCQSTAKLKIETETKGEPVVSTWFNRYAQPLLSQTQGMMPTQIIKQRVEYDRLGRVFRQSQPYFNGDSLFWTESEYDDLGRLTRTTLPFSGPMGNATVEHNYDVDARGYQQRTTLNTLNKPRTVFANALGQTMEVKDAYLKSLTYDYDSQGNLIETKDVANNSIFIKYDDLGRRKELNDPDMGISTYTYDGFGQFRTQKDAKDQVITMRYDGLGRLEERDVPLTSAPASPVETSYFTYDDLAMNAMGRISLVVKGSGAEQLNSTRYGYDQYGRLDGIVTYIKGEVFQEAVSYNSNGQLDTRGYPASGTDGTNPIPFAVKYNYEFGYLKSISGTDSNGAVCVEHWRAGSYDALGRATIDILGNIVETTRTYDQAQGVLKKLQAIVTQGNAIGTIQDIDYNYDANFNLEDRKDNKTNAFEEFDYDDLDRLLSHDNGTDIVAVTYDDIGNIKSKSDVGTYSYTGDGGPHAVGRVNSPLGTYDPLAKFQVDWEWNGQSVVNLNQAHIVDVDYAYDNNGNITQQGNRSVSWTTFDKPASMMLIGQDGVQRGSLIEYDAQFNRHYKQEGVLDALGQIAPGSIKETNYYVGKDYEKIVKENGEISHRYAIATGGGVVQVERENNSSIDIPTYVLFDNLGSTNVILNGLGEVEDRLAFDPWGMRTAVPGFDNAVNGITNRGYTGHEMDDEVGLINMNARIYDPYLGRFLSADGVLSDAENMQAFNRYSYVLGNPLKYVDPSGNVACTITTTDISTGEVTVTDTNCDEEPNPFAPPSGLTAGTNDVFSPFTGTGNFFEDLLLLGASNSFVPEVFDGPGGEPDTVTATPPPVVPEDQGDTIETITVIAPGPGMGPDRILPPTTSQELREIVSGHAAGLVVVGILTPLAGGCVAAGPALCGTVVALADASATGNPAAAIPISKVDKIETIVVTAKRATNKLRNSANFAQKTFGGVFSAGGRFAGKSVDEVADALRSGGLKVGDVPIDFVVRNGNTLILNTRSAQALTRASIPRSQWNAVNRTGQAAYEARLTGQLGRNGLTNQGISTVGQSGSE